MVKKLIYALVAVALLAGCASYDSKSLEGPHPKTLGCTMSAADLESAQVQTHLQMPGKEATVLKGAMDKKGPLEFVFSFGPHSRFPAHYHDQAEEVVVISGGLYMGDMSGMKSGGTMDTSVGTYHRKGATHFVAPKVIHWVFTQDEPVVAKVCMEGPFTMYFVEKPQ